MSILDRLAERHAERNPAAVVPVTPPKPAMRPAPQPATHLDPESFDSLLNPLVPDLRHGHPVRKQTLSDRVRADAAAVTMKLYNAMMGDHLADPSAPIHDLKHGQVARLAGLRFRAPDGSRKTDGIDYAVYDYEGRHGIVRRIGP